MKTTNFFRLGKSDLLKSLIMLAIATLISLVGDAILQAINDGTYSLSGIHWKEIGMTLLVTVLTYLKKNLFTNSDDEFLKKEDDTKMHR